MAVADHPPSSIAEVNDAWSHSSPPLYAFMAWSLNTGTPTLYHYSDSDVL